MTARLLVLLLLTATLPTFAQQTPQQLADAELPSLLTIYKGIHTHPELSTQEQRTSALLAKELKAVGCDVTENVGKYENPDQKCYGVVGLMKDGNGARAMLRDGLYTRWPKPNYALGFHDKADMEIGHIGVTEGYTSANVDSVDVTVNGIGGHGGYAYRTKDPVVLAAEMINQWQTIASRENNPIDPMVITG